MPIYWKMFKVSSPKSQAWSISFSGLYSSQRRICFSGKVFHPIGGWVLCCRWANKRTTISKHKWQRGPVASPKKTSWEYRLNLAANRQKSKRWLADEPQKEYPNVIIIRYSEHFSIALRQHTSETLCPHRLFHHGFIMFIFAAKNWQWLTIRGYQKATKNFIGGKVHPRTFGST